MRSFLTLAALAALTFAQDTLTEPQTQPETTSNDEADNTINPTTPTTPTAPTAPTTPTTPTANEDASEGATPITDVEEQFTSEETDTPEEWDEYWEITVEDVVEQITEGDMDNVPRNVEDLRTLLINSNLEWVMEIEAEAFMIDSADWDQQALRQIMNDLDYYLMTEWDIYADAYVIEHSGLHDFSIMKMDFYAATGLSIIEQVNALPWINEDSETNYLMQSELADIAAILVQHQIPITVSELEEYQQMILQFLVDFDLQTGSDLTEETICQILDVYVEEWNIADYNFRSCEQFVEGTFFNILLNWLEDETNVDLRAYGLNSIDDITEELLFSIANEELISQQEVDFNDYDVHTFDEINETCIIQMIEDHNIPISEEDKQIIEENFGPVKDQIIEAGNLARQSYVRYSEQSSNESGAASIFVSLAAVATTLVALTF